MTPCIRLLIVAGLTVAPTAAARADGLDKVLTNNARGVLAQLTAKGYANVGVLAFEVQTGGPDGPVTTSLGRMNESMATRLENALILANDEAKPIGIVRGAGRYAASRDKAATYQSKEGRAALFADGYPLAWGKTTVKPSAFLVGRVRLDREWKTATVTLRLFDERDPAAWRDLAMTGADTPVTRQTLADMGQSFAVPQLVRKRGGEKELADPFKDEEADRAAMPIVTRVTRPGEGRVPEIVPPVRAEAPVKGWGGVEELLTFRAFYDGTEVRRDVDNNYPTPKAGQKVHFTAKSTERLGLVLLVNGINTADFDKSSREVGGYVKWVLEPNQEYLIRGYYTDDKVFPFETAERKAAEEVLAELAPRPRFGQIELHVYKEVDSGTVMARNGGLREAVGTAETLAELKKDIQAHILAASRPVKKSLIIPGAGESFTGKKTDFDGTLAAKVVMTYSGPAGSSK
ncbi:MAG TPA: hypothetical protein VM533_18785 [Fimbriiglobus sp.]|jgi:hypothetical protein|nr:hypothetical protein [Fimbriiglobus sp.]